MIRFRRVRLKQCLENKSGALGSSYVTNKKFHLATREKIRKLLRPTARFVPNALRCSRVQRAGGRKERGLAVGEEEGEARGQGQ